MLSILIPIYNYDVRSLVQELDRQAAALDVPCEIFCLDDGSEKVFQECNKRISSLPNVRYEELEANVGRASIRNRLAGRARFDYLVFMDCDSQIVRPDYLQRYLDLLPSDQVLCGGRVYEAKPPEDPNLYFHWWYGKKREQRTAAERASKPHHGFMTNNFLIPKNQFKRIWFDDNIRQYGHEDTLFGLQLKEKGIGVTHIENPLEHTGLEKKEVFISKSRQAIGNLADLVQRYPALDTRLISTWKKIKKQRMTFLLRPLLHLIRPFFLLMLSGKKPSLLFFDLLKLSYFLEDIERN